MAFSCQFRLLTTPVNNINVSNHVHSHPFHPDRIHLHPTPAYVALSRGRDLEQVYLTHCDIDAIKTDSEAIAEYKRLEAKAELLNRQYYH